MIRYGIPAKQRIQEIEHGLKREFTDTMQDPYETQKVLDGLLKSATEEILIILPTTTTNNRLYRYEQEYEIASKLLEGICSPFISQNASPN